MDKITPVLQVSDMTIRFNTPGGKPKTIVEKIDFYVDPGEIVLIVGENGTGKSSIFRSLVRENDIFNFRKLFGNILYGKDKKNRELDERRLVYRGQEIDSNDKLDNFRRAIGYAPQYDDADAFLQRSVWDYVLDVARSSSEWDKSDDIVKQADSVYSALHCELYADGQLKRRRLNHCSGGEKRMATLLSALCRKRSKLFILDEPINNLDGTHAKWLNNYLISITKDENVPKKERPGVLIITHCKMFGGIDRVYTLRDSKLIGNEPYCQQNCFGECDSCGRYIINEQEETK